MGEHFATVAAMGVMDFEGVGSVELLEDFGVILVTLVLVSWEEQRRSNHRNQWL